MDMQPFDGTITQTETIKRITIFFAEYKLSKPESFTRWKKNPDNLRTREPKDT